MELVEGDAAGDRIVPWPDTRPPRRCPWREQIAEGPRRRARAGDHSSRSEAGNIKVRADGTTKVLDFGLAKAMDPVGASSASSSAPSRPSHPHPSPRHDADWHYLARGYMSPEQARGKPLDKRADMGVWLRALRDGDRHARVWGRRGVRHAGRDSRCRSRLMCATDDQPAGLAEDARALPLQRLQGSAWPTWPMCGSRLMRRCAPATRDGVAPMALVAPRWQRGVARGRQPARWPWTRGCAPALGAVAEDVTAAAAAGDRGVALMPRCSSGKD